MEVDETHNILGQGLPNMCHVNDTTKVPFFSLCSRGTAQDFRNVFLSLQAIVKLLSDRI